jgi:hypothetical protein
VGRRLTSIFGRFDNFDIAARFFGQQFHSKTAMGERIKPGSVTLIRILTVNVNFAGGSVAAPAANAPGFEGFLMSGEAKPLGFVSALSPVVNAPDK